MGKDYTLRLTVTAWADSVSMPIFHTVEEGNLAPTSSTANKPLGEAFAVQPTPFVLVVEYASDPKQEYNHLDGTKCEDASKLHSHWRWIHANGLTKFRIESLEGPQPD